MDGVYDILSVKYPDCDFVMMMDHITGCMRKRKDGSNEKQLTKNWGGKGGFNMRKIVVTEVGEYGVTYQVGEEQ